ncbi:MAG: hypothetical protein V2I33_15045, partial [Kangiellaceae bacterium]|nr:hypothetical protein [Kangiellaceae bacterium]
MIRVFALLSFLLCNMLSFSASNPVDSVPSELKPWIKWSTKDLDFLDCPMTEGGRPTNETDRICAWPGLLDIEINRTRGQFSQNWKVYKDSWVPLPGDKYSWPAMVEVNGKGHLLQSRNGSPYIFLKKGVAKVTGYWRWDSQPEEVRIPQLSGRLSLKLNQRQVRFPEVDSGILWLGEREHQEQEADEIQLKVFRKISDGQPIFDQTQIYIWVAGKAREINLGSALLRDFQLVGTDGELPAIVNENNELVIQAKPGRWELSIKSFAKQSLTELQMTRNNELWPEQEIWSYQANEKQRITNIEGLSLIDPDTADIPSEWANLPSYIVTRINIATLNEKLRGMPTENTDRISLQRNIWLDFNGEHWRFEDQLKGEVRHNWRLDMEAPYRLEYAKEDGEPLLITSHNDQQGIEIRYPLLNVTGGGEIDNVDNLAISGWNNDLDSAYWSLNLPPAHRLLWAVGAESSNAWSELWNLWNLFWVLLITIVAWKNVSSTVGVVAFLTLILLMHELSAPLISFSNLILSYALFNNISVDKVIIKRSVKSYFLISALIFLFNAGLYGVQQVRVMIHPQLEHNSVSENYVRSPMSNFAADAISYEAAEQSMRKRAETSKPAAALLEDEEEKVVITGSRIKRSEMLGRYENDTVLQTGTGKPMWQWNSYRLDWQSPISKEQRVELVIATPVWMLLWRLLSIAGLSLVALVALIKFVPDEKTRKWLPEGIQKYL